ncbi:hypothetical protein BC6307_21085 [Sutcliffiella cohnii]|uniref:Uncharacterized protein n=1 Tax=Sutcliffiella cohnii TaxID=33932 RepID=A0A223KW35_9BACI|nr:hypothetical protein [Sutcliffiella cohnii]AST93583.1 hypothetical protein BC6307_21085 [Sutcliffiella cohnii]
MGILLILFLAGCTVAETTNTNENGEDVTTSLKEQIKDLEKELDTQSRTLAETEKELEELKINDSEDHVYNEEEFIIIPRETAPNIRNNPDVQLWEIVSDFSLGYELMGYVRGETNWREWDGEIGEPFMSINEEWETPGHLLSNWVNYHGFSYENGTGVLEVTMRVDYDDEKKRATGYVLIYGIGDDSVAGSVKKVIMNQENDRWYIEEVFIRNQCYRSVGEDGELCV